MTEATANTHPEQTTDQPTEKRKTRRQSNEKSIGTLSLTEVDGALAGFEKIIRSHTELVKTKLSTGSSIPSDVLRDLATANRQKGRLTMRRIALLIETGDAVAMDLIEKLCKVKPPKAAA